ncbi:hypothetical protein ACO0QE_000387 [Hanseniaspora vineae]
MFNTSLKRSSAFLIKRQLHASQMANKASFFGMPAMSPTMTEGGVVDWKFKAGDSFNAGDVLLEVETDKATIDVEAVDDGKVAKILMENGAKKIPVNTPIAVMAEPEDDLATLEMPEEPKKETAPPAKEEPKKEAPKKEAPKKQPKKKTTEPKASSSSPSSSSSSPASTGLYTKADPSQTLYPSVANLLHANNISTGFALEEIPASGPKGKILKGDVLAYLGKITKDNLSKVTEYINKGTVLDLSNIELRKPQPAAADAAAQKAVKPEPVVLRETFVLPLLETTVSESDLEYVVGKKIDELVAKAHTKKPVKSQYYDSLFEDLIAVEPFSARFAVSWSLVSSSLGSSGSNVLNDSLFDYLVSHKVSDGLQNSRSAPVTTPTTEYSISVEVLVSDKYEDAQAKSEQFLNSFQDYVLALSEA